MVGDADIEVRGNRDGIVTLGETIDYVRDRVEAATAFGQQPQVSGTYDGRLPLSMALVQSASVQSAPVIETAQGYVARPPSKKRNGKVKVSWRPLAPIHLHARVPRPEAFFVLQAMEIPIAPSEDERKRAPAL